MALYLFNKNKPKGKRLKKITLTLNPKGALGKEAERQKKTKKQLKLIDAKKK